jgi:SAM-dependent methyltransferase
MVRIAMETKHPIPPNRTLEQLRTHYAVEKAIAERLKRSTREERSQIFATMYDELFRRVPDHPRLTRRQDDAVTRKANQTKLRLLRPYLDKSKVFLEYAPGDCRFAIDVAKYVRFSYGLDISDQRRADEANPENFRLVVYDGYSIDRALENSIDVMFSDQLIEHFHPDDTRLHFEAAHRLLKKGGLYIFRTPHRATGPHDISMFFSDVPEGFHLKEWTYTEIRTLLHEVGYSSFHSYWCRGGFAVRLPYLYFGAAEALLGRFSRDVERRLATYAVPELVAVVEK